MTSRRRLLVLAVAGAAVALAVGAWWVWPRSAITPENAARIQPGMTVEELEAILGCPPGNYATGPLEIDQPFQEPKQVPRWTRIAWTSDVASINVWLDAKGRVDEVETVLVRRRDERPP
jgi:hypothetical protein